MAKLVCDFPVWLFSRLQWLSTMTVYCSSDRYCKLNAFYWLIVTIALDSNLYRHSCRGLLVKTLYKYLVASLSELINAKCFNLKQCNILKCLAVQSDQSICWYKSLKIVEIIWTKLPFKKCRMFSERKKNSEQILKCSNNFLIFDFRNRSINSPQ